MEEQIVAVGFGELVGLDDELAKPRAGRDDDLDLLLLGADILIEQFLIGLNARFALGLPGARGGPHPFKLARQCFLARGLGLFFDLESRAFLFEPGSVVALPGNTLAAIQLQDPARDIV